MEAILLIGIQGAGKSSFYRDHFADSHIRLNMDMLRTRRRESIMLQACIEAKQAFVVDNTNPSVEERARYIAPARVAGFKVSGYFFSLPIELALARNAVRDEAARVPPVAIRGTRNRQRLPSISEGFDALSLVRVLPDTYELEEWNREV